MTVESFDQWYRVMGGERGPKDVLTHRVLGLPPEILSTSLLPMDGLLEIRDLLELHEGQLLVDLACGRGGYGMWLARNTGASTIGIDVSAVAIEQSCARRAIFGLPEDRARFHVASIEVTGLDDAVADAIICVDAIQFTNDPRGAAAEMSRVLKPEGLAVLTCWEANDRTDEQLPERVRRLDLATQLAAGGLVDVRVRERPSWQALETQLWEQAIAADATGDPALQDLKDEAARVLPIAAKTRRVVATARAVAQ